MQIRAVIDIIQEVRHVGFVEALGMFYKSHTYQVLREVDNGFWAESPEFIADCFFEDRYRWDDEDNKPERDSAL